MHISATSLSGWLWYRFDVFIYEKKMCQEIVVYNIVVISGTLIENYKLLSFTYSVDYKHQNVVFDSCHYAICYWLLLLNIKYRPQTFPADKKRPTSFIHADTNIYCPRIVQNLKLYRRITSSATSRNSQYAII